MKKTVLIVLVTVCSVALTSAGLAFAHSTARASASYAAVDDPPPEPLTCPLCAGDPMLHARRMFQLETLSGSIAAGLLRW